eukprot:s2150_g7.t1
MPNESLDETFNTTLTTVVDAEVSDIIEDVRDIKDQMKISRSRNQVAYRLDQEAEKQRSEAACKIMVKNCRRYVEFDRSYLLLREHPEKMMNWAAQAAGINRQTLDGKSITPLTLVSAEVTGMIEVRPCKIHKNDGMQTELLKAMMAVTTIWTFVLRRRHSWKHLAFHNPEMGRIAWLALGHLLVIAKAYLDRRLFAARQFEDEFHATLSAQITRKAVGAKGKGTNKGGDGALTAQYFLKAVG